MDDISLDIAETRPLPSVRTLEAQVAPFAGAAVLCVAWLAMTWSIRPHGEFPLNDDWAYTLPVQAWVEQGRLHLTGWQSMPLLLQFAWGALFCLPLGFSFSALRISTLVLGGVGALVTARVLHERGVPRSWSTIAALGLLANPIYCALSNTFMSDVPFLAVFMLSALYLLRALETERLAPLATGIAFAMAATLIRQIGVALPCAFATAALVTWGFGRRFVLYALIPTVLVLGLVPVTEAFLSRTVGVPSNYHARDGLLLAAMRDLLQGHPKVLLVAAGRVFDWLLCAGLFLLPLTMGLFARARRVHRALLLVALGGAISGVLLAAGYVFPRPVLGNVLLHSGIGPSTLPGAPPAASVAMTMLASVGALALCALLFEKLSGTARDFASGKRHGAPVFAVTISVLTLAPLALAYGASFDRYVLPVLPMLLVLLLTGLEVRTLARAALPLTTGLTVVTAVLTTCAVHDYLAWNRARWTAATDFQRRMHVAAADLEAGFEYDNYTANAGLARFNDQPVDRTASRYALKFAAESTDHPLARYAIDSWLAIAPRELVIIERPERR